MPDLSGHKFGRWLVLHKDLDRLDHKGIKSYYRDSHLIPSI